LRRYQPGGFLGPWTGISVSAGRSGKSAKDVLRLVADPAFFEHTGRDQRGGRHKPIEYM